MTDPQRQHDELANWLRDERGDLVRLARSILHDPDEAEDVVQETLLAVLRQSRPIRRLGGYLARAVYWNALKQRARRRSRIVLVYGGGLSGGAQLTLIILGLMAGSVMGIASAVVGITIPTAVSSGGLELARACCEPEAESDESSGNS